MKLYSNSASPFGRKCKVIAQELGLKLEVVRTLPVQDPDFRRVNPLGKIPALVLDDGSVLFDSRVICEYLNDRGGGGFFPVDTIWKNAGNRWKSLGLQALGDGVSDAAVAWVMLGREPVPPEATRARQIAAIEAGLDAAEHVTLQAPVTIGEVSIGCALGYIDFRLPDMDWRATRPRLAAWYAVFSQWPPMQATLPAQP